MKKIWINITFFYSSTIIENLGKDRKDLKFSSRKWKMRHFHEMIDILNTIVYIKYYETFEIFLSFKIPENIAPVSNFL